MDIDKAIAVLEHEVAGYRVPVADLVAVQTNDPFKVLVATILSARTKDETTAAAAARLFKKAPDIEGLRSLGEEQIAKLIYPVGFYKSKAGYLARLPEALDAFGGAVPEEIDELTTLPGVGRKTANLVRSVAFGKDAICVDTHVHRIMNIWGYVRTKTPGETETALRQKLPRRHWRRVNSILVAFGQGTCKPVAPHCDRCVLADACPRIGVTPRRPPLSKGGRGGGLRLVSWNVNGIRAAEKKGFAAIVEDLAPDILAVQETKASAEQLSEKLLRITGYTSFWHSAEKKGYSGVALYCRKEPIEVVYGLGRREFDQEGRVLTVEYDSFFLVNCYFPNAQHGLKRLDYKLAFDRALQEYATGLSRRKSVVICGDFNVAHKEIDLANPKSNVKNPGFTPQERAWMDEFMGAGFVDTFRMFNRKPGQYTWWSYRFNARARNIGWRIDYFCVDEGCRDRVKESVILPEIMGSDHCPILMELRR